MPVPPLTIPTTIERPNRWQQPFGDMVDHLPGLMEQPFFKAMQDRYIENCLLQRKKMDPGIDLAGVQKRLQANNPIRALLQNDAAVRPYNKGEIILRKGDYGNSAFVILQGHVVITRYDRLAEEDLGRRKTERGHKGLYEAIALFFRRNPVTENRNTSHYDKENINIPANSDLSAARVTLNKALFDTITQDTSATHRMGPNQLFGELAALGRSERMATVIAADDDLQLLEIRWQGLRDLMRYDAVLHEKVMENYRNFGLQEYLHNNAPFNIKVGRKHGSDTASSLFQDLPPTDQQRIIKQTHFENYGSFDWYQSFGAEKVPEEPIIAKEGHYVEGLFMIRAGFARVSIQLQQGRRTLTVLRRGDTFGLDELVYNWKHPDKALPFQRSLSAIGNTDVLRVPTNIVEEYLLPKLPAAELPAMAFPKTSAALNTDRSDSSTSIDTKLIDFLIENRFINGTKAMAIDLDRCVRCDDCVRACAATHDNNPRFVRRGKRIDNLMITNACMHCSDPVCMIGCPTGAIHRDWDHGVVVINDRSCIGCGTCASSCPYGNIQMVKIRDQKDQFIRDSSQLQPIVKATKCDMCIDNPQVSPACENACPHDALIRIDMNNPTSLVSWLQR